MRFSIAAALTLVAAPLLAQPAASKAPATKPPARVAARDSFALTAALPNDPAVRQGTLANGLRYYVRRNAKPEKRVELRLVVNAGSILEDEDQRGLAHFLEHMAFNGTKHFAKNDIVKYLESIGVRFGADLNAYTSFDETVYILPVPSDSARILERSFEFLGDVASGILFDSTDVVAERGVVLSEWRNGLGADERIRDKQFPVIFKGSKYADRLPIGLPTVLEQANPAPLRRFWRDWYRPDLTAVVAVGDADPARLEALIRRTFAPIPKRTTSRPRALAAVPSHDETLVTIATDKEQTGSSVAVLWKVAPRRTRTVGEFRERLVERLYTSMINQRFSELAQKPDVPFLGGGAGTGSFVRSSDYYQLSAGAKEGKLLESLALLVTEAERAQRHGFLQSELDRSRTNLLRLFERSFDERDKTSSGAYVGSYIEHFLSGDSYTDQRFDYAAAQRLLPTITLAEVNALGKQLSGERNRVVTVTMPEKAGLAVPTEADVRGIFTRVVASNITPYVETVSEGALVTKVPTPGRVVAEKKHASIDVTEWTLSNGVRVFVKPNDYNADQIAMSAWSPGGASLLDDSTVFRAALTTTVLAQGGVGDFSLVDLRKKLTGKVASVGATIADRSEGLSGNASPKDLETMMQLIWLRMTAPRADSGAYQAILQQFDAVLKNKDANPQAVFSDTVQTTLANGSPRVRPISTETLKELDLRKMEQLYRERFGDASEFTFLFVGNVDPATLKPLAEQWLAALPSTGRKETPRDVGPKMLTGQTTKIVKKGQAPQSQTVSFTFGTASWSREQAYLISSLGDVLESRLLDRLREALGGTYSVSVSTGFSRMPRQEWQMVIAFGSAPEKADTLWAAVEQELDSLRRVPPTAAEVERVREKQRRAQETSRKQNGYWMGVLRDRIETGEDITNVNIADALIAGLSVDKLAAAAKIYLDQKNRARFVLLPEGGAAIK